MWNLLSFKNKATRHTRLDQWLRPPAAGTMSRLNILRVMSHLGIEDTVWWAFKRCPLNKSQWFIVAYYPPKKRWVFLVSSTYLNIFYLQEKRNDVWQFFQVPFQTNIEVSPPKGIALPSSTVSSITLREDSMHNGRPFIDLPFGISARLSKTNMDTEKGAPLEYGHFRYLC